MNRIIKPFLEEHIKEFELKGDEAQCFEHLVNYIAMRDYSSRHFDPSDASLGKGEVGIDGIGIFANDILVSTFQELESIFVDINGKKNADISIFVVFTQAKTSENFVLSEFSHFLTSVFDFVRGGDINKNNRALELQKMFKYIVDNPTQLSKNPDCHMIYSYTGIYQNENIIDSTVDTYNKSLQELNIFDEIKFSVYDSKKIVTICRSIKNSIEKTVAMENCSILPSIKNVKEAFIGAIKCKDYVNLITNEDGLLLSYLFEDNVRYFQGHNKVNSEMQATVSDDIQQQAFSLLNNGVTIIAREIRRTANNFVLKNFQIVNGCQTSFVLYENRKKLNDNSYVIVKLISSTDKDVADSIVKTTNRQTPVTDEAFETLRDFHKDLETVYASYDIKYRLFYERRSKQYESSDINKNRIVSFPSQTAAYVAMFLGEPQSTHRYYGELLKSYKTKMYQEEDVKNQYCISSMYLFFIDKYLREDGYTDYRKYKYHIALLCRIIVAGNKLPKANSKDMEKLCLKLYENLKDEHLFEDSVKQAINIIDTVVSAQSKLVINGNDVSRTREFTAELISKLGSRIDDISVDRAILPLIRGSHFRCKVIGWGRAFAYVEIIDHKEAGQIHISNISKHYINDISEVLKKGEIIDATVISDLPTPRYGYELSIVH